MVMRRLALVKRRRANGVGRTLARRGAPFYFLVEPHVFARASRCQDQSAFMPVVCSRSQAARSGHKASTRSIVDQSVRGCRLDKNEPGGGPPGEVFRAGVDHGIGQATRGSHHGYRAVRETIKLVRDHTVQTGWA